MADQCYSICPDDRHIRCVHEQGHDFLKTDVDGELIESDHANPDAGAFWTTGVPAHQNVELQLTGDQYDALLTLLEDEEAAAPLLRVIIERS